MKCGNSLHPPWFRLGGVQYERGKGLFTMNSDAITANVFFLVNNYIS